MPESNTHLHKVRDSGIIIPCNLQHAILMILFTFPRLFTNWTQCMQTMDACKPWMTYTQNDKRPTPLYRCFQCATFDTPHSHHDFCMQFWPTKSNPMQFCTFWSCVVPYYLIIGNNSSEPYPSVVKTLFRLGVM